MYLTALHWFMRTWLTNDTKSSPSNVFRGYPVVFLRRGAVIVLIRDEEGRWSTKTASSPALNKAHLAWSRD